MATESSGLTGESIAVPGYLEQTYWWAYIHPRGVRLFERQWLVNLILWGNFNRLRDAALDALGPELGGLTLQVACVYGDLTSRLSARLRPDGHLHVVDVLPIQLRNLAAKLPGDAPVTLLHGDSARLDLPTAGYDRALLFFLLHEQPLATRRATLAETLRVVRRGGRIVIVDYHRPHPLNPLLLPMAGVLRTLEPFALDLWAQEISAWFPGDVQVTSIEKQTLFGSLYQVISITV